MDLQASLTNGSAHHEQENPTDEGINGDITTSTPTRNNHRALRRTADAGVNGAMSSEEDLLGMLRYQQPRGGSLSKPGGQVKNYPIMHHLGISQEL